MSEEKVRPDSENDDNEELEEGEGGDDPSKKTDTTDDEDAEKGDRVTSEDEDNDDIEVPTRSSVNASHIISRQQRTIKKLRKGEDDEGDEDDEGEELTPEAGSAISKEVERQTKPYAEHVARQADETELQSLFQSNPDAKKYEKRIRKFMSHDAWKGVPITAIYHHLSYDKAQALGSKRKKDADDEAGETHSGGHGVRKKTTTDGNVPDVSEMSDEELEELGNKAKQGEFLPSDDPRI